MNLRNCKGRAPLLFKDVKANAAIAVDVGMKHLCAKRHLSKRTMQNNMKHT